MATGADLGDSGEREERDLEAIWLPRLVWALVLLAFALRLPGALHNSANPDEGFYLRFASVPSWSDFVRMTLLTPHPPLFFSLQRVLATVSPELVPLRMISVVSGALGVHALWKLGCEVQGRSVGLVAAVLLCFAPGAIVLSQVARPYAFLFVVLAYSLTALLAHLRSGSRRALYLHAATMAAALFTHYGAFPVAVAGGLVLIGDALLEPESRKQLRARLQVEIALACSSILLLVFHLRPHVLETSMQRSAQTSWLAPFFVSSPVEAWLGILGLQRYLFGTELEALAALSLVAGFCTLVWRRKYALPALVVVSLALWIGLSALDQYPLGSTRHSFMGNVLLLPLIALPYGWALRRGLPGLTVAALVAGIVLSFPALPRALVGAEALKTRASVEFVALAEDLDPQIEFLEALRDEPAMILMDRQTWNMLAPVWVEAGVFPERRQDYFRYAYDWGQSRIGVTEAWILRAAPDGPRMAQHLNVAIRQFGRVMPSWRESERKGWLFLGGWGSETEVALRDANGRLDSSSQGVIEEIVESPGLLRARVDFSRYLELVDALASDAPEDASGEPRASVERQASE